MLMFSVVIYSSTSSTETEYLEQETVSSVGILRTLMGRARAARVLYSVLEVLTHVRKYGVYMFCEEGQAAAWCWGESLARATSYEMPITTQVLAHQKYISTDISLN